MVTVVVVVTTVFFTVAVTGRWARGEGGILEPVPIKLFFLALLDGVGIELAGLVGVEGVGVGVVDLAAIVCAVLAMLVFLLLALLVVVVVFFVLDVGVGMVDVFFVLELAVEVGVLVVLFLLLVLVGMPLGFFRLDERGVDGAGDGDGARVERGVDASGDAAGAGVAAASGFFLPLDDAPAAVGLGDAATDAPALVTVRLVIVARVVAPPAALVLGLTSVMILFTGVAVAVVDLAAVSRFTAGDDTATEESEEAVTSPDAAPVAGVSGAGFSGFLMDEVLGAAAVADAGRAMVLSRLAVRAGDADVTRDDAALRSVLAVREEGRAESLAANLLRGVLAAGGGDGDGAALASGFFLVAAGVARVAVVAAALFFGVPIASRSSVDAVSISIAFGSASRDADGATVFLIEPDRDDGADGMRDGGRMPDIACQSGWGGGVRRDLNIDACIQHGELLSSMY